MLSAATILARIAAHPRLAALGLGLAAASGFQPLGLWPLALAAMGGFLLLLGQAPNWREATRLGWLFGLAHFTFANNWIATAFTYQANMPAILGWLAVPLLALYLAVYPALAAGASWRLAGRRGGWPLALAFAGCWTIAEWLRGWVFTGYAWDPFGVVLLGGYSRPGIALLAPWLGTYGLSGLAVLLGAALTLLLARRRFVPLGILAAVTLAGMVAPPLGAQHEGTLRFTLVQPDIEQDVLNEPVFFDRKFRKIASFTLPRDPTERRLVLWPESGITEYLESGYPQRYYDWNNVLADPVLTRQRVARVIGPGGMLLTGTTNLELADGEAVGARNSVSAIDGKGAIAGSYDKAHLVPYGEYLPMRWLLEPLGATRLVPGALDFWPGPGPRTIDLGPWGKAGVQICYEIVFSGEVVDPDNRPDYIFNPSNDGWFGSFGPPQHLAQARLRAIEEGLPVLRGTTTGISAVIDARGVVRDFAPMHQARRLEGYVPPALPPTLFAQAGNLLPLAWALLLLLGSVAALRRGR
jgi:apolipoprotein N-acyltransferase